MKMVEESKNERLTTLLQKTDELLQSLGAMVQQQKDADWVDVGKKEKSKDKAKEIVKTAPEASSPREKQGAEEKIEGPSPKNFEDRSFDDADEVLSDYDGEGSIRKRDLLQGQRQYNSLVHSIEEKVMVSHVFFGSETFRFC
jgi:SWI/SNF-related matrix-associated actin-dependent regulator of chromatin subfamily A protein 2/4